MGGTFQDFRKSENTPLVDIIKTEKQLHREASCFYETQANFTHPK